MEAIKEKMRQKLLQKKEQVQTSSTKETEEEYIRKMNQFKEQKYQEEKEKQGQYLDQIKQEIEQLTQQMENSDEKTKSQLDILVELNKCLVLIKETTLDLNLEIQQIWSNFKVKENFTDIAFKKKFFLENVEKYDWEILYNYMYKSAQYEAFQ